MFVRCFCRHGFNTQRVKQDTDTVGCRGVGGGVGARGINHQQQLLRPEFFCFQLNRECLKAASVAFRICKFRVQTSVTQRLDEFWQVSGLTAEFRKSAVSTKKKRLANTHTHPNSPKDVLRQSEAPVI